MHYKNNYKGLCKYRLFSKLSPFILSLAVNASALEIEVSKEDWGNAGEEDIKAVLHSAASAIYKHCLNTRIDPMLVHRRFDYPQANHDRDSSGRIVIGLQTGDKYWAQYAYQFSHEFCHVLAGHSNDWRKKWRSLDTPHLWFEECLCEVASLFTLRSMGQSWGIDPPYPNWKSYAPSLKKYAQERINDPENMLPAGDSFYAWFKKHENELRHKWKQRDKNTIVAKQLLPLFEAYPEAWESVTYINLVSRDQNLSFYEFLCNWKKVSPKNHQDFIDKIFVVFYEQGPP